MAWGAPGLLLFSEAVDWFAGKLDMTRAEVDALTLEARSKAFYVSGLAQLDMVAEVHQALDKAVQKGTTLAEFTEDVGDTLEAAWGGEQPWRLETVFRTNVQSAYSAGRLKQQLADTEDRPFWKYSAILDGRTTPVCKAANGTTRPADDPWWNDHQPPCHFNCRSTVIALTQEQAQEEGIAHAGPDVPPAKGFGNPLVPMQVDLSTRPPSLVSVFLAKLQQGPLQAPLDVP